MSPSKYRVVLQARTSSTRLAAKVLLPVAGTPMAVLAARRAGRGGADVVLATSSDRSDDVLAALANANSIRTVRGSLNDVLSRFVLATAEMGDEDVCVRLTADNVLPDADLIDTVVRLFEETGAPYLAYGSSSRDGLPYGVSAEVFRVGTLREADRATVSGHDREHVTPFIRRHHARETMPPLPGLNRDYGHLSCTVDTLAEYHRINRLFDRVADPVCASWTDLVARLAENEDAPRFKLSGRREDGAAFVLGAAQIGLTYGRANRSGMPSDDAAQSILRSAVAHGASQVDTARAYGDSESRLGRFLSSEGAGRMTAITKLSPLPDLADELSPAGVRAMVDASVLASCRALRCERLPTVITHRAAHLTALDGAVWKRLVELKGEGVIGRLGCSLQSPAEMADAMRTPHVEHIQLPYNVLDSRWDEFGDDLRRRGDVTVHVRSSLLQGLLATRDARLWPAIPGLDGEAVLSALRAMADELGRESVVDLCLAAVRGRPWVDGVVVGVDDVDQLTTNMAMFTSPPLTEGELKLVREALPAVPASLLDPSTWPSVA